MRTLGKAGMMHHGVARLIQNKQLGSIPIPFLRRGVSACAPWNATQQFGGPKSGSCGVRKATVPTPPGLSTNDKFDWLSDGGHGRHRGTRARLKNRTRWDVEQTEIREEMDGHDRLPGGRICGDLGE